LVPPPSQGPVTFVVASRWNSWKGHEFLLRAWELAGCPGRLVVLGGAPEAGIGVDVPGLVAGLSQPQSVQIVGEVDDITPWLDAAHALVLPSTNPEPFGLVVVEAFARARPVVATDHGAPSTVVAPGVGWLVAPGDVAQLATILAGITAQEATRRGQAARALFEREYSMDAWRIAVRGLLQRFVGAERPSLHP
jgi:glycosyltransferase involved in cell wall biosynthesis